MADEEKNEPEDQQPEPEEAPEETPAAEEAPAEEETPETDDSAEGSDHPAEPDAGASEADDQSGEAERAGAEDSAGDVEELTPKERRKLERSHAGGPAGPQRSPDERASQRAERRRRAAVERGRYRRKRRERRGDRRSGTPAAERAPGKRKIRLGTVVSSRSAKTITVRIERARRDPGYEKVVRRSNTVHAHDERDEASEGDVVRVVETRPMSRTKRWRLLEIVERAR
jgi:small subunit ribosomal protein S17